VALFYIDGFAVVVVAVACDGVEEVAGVGGFVFEGLAWVEEVFGEFGEVVWGEIGEGVWEVACVEFVEFDGEHGGGGLVVHLGHEGAFEGSA